MDAGLSAQPCGCDENAGWVCARHLLEKNVPQDRGPDRIFLSAAEWRAFSEACRAVDVPITLDAYVAWRSGTLGKEAAC